MLFRLSFLVNFYFLKCPQISLRTWISDLHDIDAVVVSSGIYTDGFPQQLRGIILEHIAEIHMQLSGIRIGIMTFHSIRMPAVDGDIPVFLNVYHLRINAIAFFLHGSALCFLFRAEIDHKNSDGQEDQSQESEHKQEESDISGTGTRFSKQHTHKYRCPRKHGTDYGKNDSEDPRVEKYLDMAWEVLNDPTLPRDGYHAFTVSKCAPTFRYYGFFIYAKELEERVKRVYGES